MSAAKPPAPEETRCDRCGLVLPDKPGARHRIVIHVHSLFHPDEAGEPPPGDSAALLEELAANLARQSEGGLESQVFTRLSFTVCAACRERFLADPLA